MFDILKYDFALGKLTYTCHHIAAQLTGVHDAYEFSFIYFIQFIFIHDSTVSGFMYLSFYNYGLYKKTVPLCYTRKTEK